MPYPQVYNRKTKRMEYLHRVVAAKQLGRALEPGEVVHHINGDKQDARPENLAVLRVGEHSWVEWLIRRWRRGQPLLLSDAIPENLKTCFPDSVFT
ncbi:HNH endonuclease [Deinococcus sp. SDU3-2]|uniref:HNH endonuclease n=1 Tax=Deinococcus terrestris TaxID=2651870 RepID=A0A7X1NZV5_9DEIO|nr:HNH endonuclease [Deinococcus terrestris]